MYMYITFIWVPLTSQEFAHSPPPTPGKISPTKFVFSHHQKSILPSLLIKSYNSGKTSYLAVVIAPVPFYFNFILFWHTGHANFDFNWSSVFTECCFELWKKFKSSKSLLRFSSTTTPSSSGKISDSCPPPPGGIYSHHHLLLLFGKPWIQMINC